MTLAIRVSVRRFTGGDAIGKRWLYIAATVGARTAWLQWWPAYLPGKRRLTSGIRGGSG